MFLRRFTRGNSPAGLSGFGMLKGRSRALNWSGGGGTDFRLILISYLFYLVYLVQGDSFRLVYGNDSQLGNIPGKDIIIYCCVLQEYTWYSPA